MKTKQEYRGFYLERRNRLDEEDVKENSVLLFERICSLEYYKNADIILAYMSFGNEVYTGHFIRRCIRDGKRVALPRVEKLDGKCCRLSLYVLDPVNDMVQALRGYRARSPKARCWIRTK